MFTLFLFTDKLLFCISTTAGSEFIDLTRSNAINISLANSYQVLRLKLGLERSMHNLAATRAGLRSRVYMNLQVPTINSTSSHRWNSTLQRDELVYSNNRRFQAELAIRQPVMLFGYPTNGYLSLNSRIYRYDQWFDSEDDTDFYNRHFIRFVQPLFQPNELKNDLERSEMNLDNEQMSYIADIVTMVDRLTRDYDNLFSEVYTYHIINRWVENLEHAEVIVNQLAFIDSTKDFDAMQIRLELSNIQERLAGQQSAIRMEMSDMIQTLRLEPGDSLHIEPTLHITPVTVNLDEAIHYGFTLRPRLRQLQNSLRRNELGLEETKARNAFRMDLNVTYGLEKKDDDYMRLLNDQTNSYSVALSAYVPIWDWGQRNHRIASSSINIERDRLAIEETQANIESQITMAVENLQEYQSRALSMEKNAEIAMQLTTESLQRLSDGSLSTQDVLRMIERQYDTERNFLSAYLSYRRALRSLATNTYYDFENNLPLIDSYLEQGLSSKANGN